MTQSARLHLGLTMLLLGTAGTLPAQDSAGPTMTAEEFEAKLGYQTGNVELPGGMATIHLPASFRFIGEEGSKRLLVKAWGNPPETAEDVLGMLIPTATSPVSDSGWGIVITYDEDGYVTDSGAAAIDYTAMLAQMQEGVKKANEERRKQGFEEVALIGWAEPPYYDREAHKMYWAKELAFSDSPENHTLNYNIRILGRRGVLVLNAVAGMDQLAVIKAQTPDVLGAVEFNEGHRYADYLPGKDKAATYGIAGLILGATAAKAGLFKGLIAGLIALKKVIIAGIAAGLALLKRKFGKGDAKPESPPAG